MRFWEKINDDKLCVEMFCVDEWLCNDMKIMCYEESVVKKFYECIVICCYDDVCNLDLVGISVSLCLVIFCIVVGVIEVFNLI